MSKTILIFLFIFVWIMPSTCVYCQDSTADRRVMTFEGTVSDVDWVASRFVVRGETDAVFTVSSDTKITKGVETVGLDDVELSDPVSVGYYIDSSGTAVALYIIVNII